MSYNVHHGEGMDGEIDLGRIAQVILREKADLVALQEVDRGVRRTGGVDMPAELARLTGMTAVFSNNFSFQGGEYGNAILSRFPIDRSQNTHYAMVREGEQRGLLRATVNVDGQRLLFMATHLDYRPDDAERMANVRELIEMIHRDAALPVIIAGDFNDVPGSRTHAAMKQVFQDVWEIVGQDHGYTFSSVQPTRRIDYVFYKPEGALTPQRAWVPLSLASDHLPLVVEFRLE
jgi:endonuclease/exonuclease/phosphatase family metal-dependent hydrolase